MRWNADGRIGSDSYLRLTSDPAFPQAARALATNNLAAAAADTALDGIFKDAGRYLVALFAIYLHVSGGVTLPRLKTLCAASGFLSPGRARALLIYLRYLGYLELFPAGRRGMPARYIPTARFLTAWRAHMRAILDAARHVEPAAERVLDRLDAPDIFDTFVRFQCRGLMESARDSNQGAAFVRVFLQRHAGAHILRLLVIAGEADVFPPRGPLPISLSEAARRFGVSRMHVRRLLDEAEHAGLLRRPDDGTVVLEEEGRAGVELLYSTQLIRVLTAAAKTLREKPELMSGRTPSRLVTPAAWGRREGRGAEARPS